MKHITKVVWILSFISLFTDIASEMLYPVMPVYLKSIGFSVVLIGVLEGIAEVTAGLSKGFFGRFSDAKGRRVPFVQLGYGLSAVSKPLLILFVQPLWVFFARTLDRFGKGIRTGARDALLSDESTPATKGRVFGFHRSMDTLGAAIGPILALVYLAFYPEDYKTLFIIAIVPGILSIFLSLRLREKKSAVRTGEKVSFASFFNYWKKSPEVYKRVAVGFLLFALFNSSDMFLLLRVSNAGMNDVHVIGLYIFYNLVYALLAYPLGIIADRVGLKQMFLFGLLLFAVVYAGFSFLDSTLLNFGVLFFVYGIFAAMNEGISKAWLSNIVPKHEAASAIGTFAGFQSLAAFLASSMTGLIWYWFGFAVALVMSAAMAVLVIVYFLIIGRAKQTKN